MQWIVAPGYRVNRHSIKDIISMQFALLIFGELVCVISQLSFAGTPPRWLQNFPRGCPFGGTIASESNDVPKLEDGRTVSGNRGTSHFLTSREMHQVGGHMRTKSRENHELRRLLFEADII